MTGPLVVVTVVAVVAAMVRAGTIWRYGGPVGSPWLAGRRTRAGRLLAAVVGVALLVLMVAVLLSGHAFAADPATLPAAAPPPPAAPTDLNTVITNLRNWMIGICAGVATLFFTVGGLRYMGANGDPSEVDSAKRAFRNAAVGYALAILAPLFLTALKSVVGA